MHNKHQKDQAQVFRDRLKNLEVIKSAGVDPYPETTERTHTSAEVHKQFESLTGVEVTVVGRIMSERRHGRLLFANLQDGTDSIQISIREDEVGTDMFNFWKLLDIGDFIQTTGKPYKTKRGEETIETMRFRLLSKSLRPLPEKYHGLQDEETRLRKRYLELITNPETRALFRRKAIFFKAIRRFMDDHNFMEVQTSALEAVAGGAEARPFMTHHNALDIDMYLRIALEIPQKKLLVGGYEKIYEMGRVFRNEGIDQNHLQDYVAMEFYWAYANFEDLLTVVEQLFRFVIAQTFETTSLTIQGKRIEFGGAKAWLRLDYSDLFKKATGMDLRKGAVVKELQALAKRLKLDVSEAKSAGRMIDLIYKKTVRPYIDGPAFLINHPVAVSPLSKRDPKNPHITKRVQLLVLGAELCNAFAELNDPIDQRQRFEEQAEAREAGDDEAHVNDTSFVEALEYGMPPAAGFGFSERVFAMLSDKSIRETVFFPPMRPETPAAETPEQPMEIKKFQEADNNNIIKDIKGHVHIDHEVRKLFPGLKVGMAVIDGVSVAQTDPLVDTYVNEVIATINPRALLEKSPVLQAYRDMFKATKLDPKKKKPSPVALLERLADGKSLYNVNTLVDVANAVVLRTGVSVGAFDADHMRLPMMLRLSKDGELFTPIGDKQRTVAAGELVYADAHGLITRGLNYRDADRTKVTLSTKRVILLIDGTHAHTKAEVEDALSILCDLVQKVCGGRISSRAFAFNL